jgi:gliding motility-associated-like protein
VQSRALSRDWYEFTCSVPGTLSFTINPDRGDDWDWELFDITGHSDPDDIYTDSSLIVACNWSKNTSSDPGYTSVTGTSPSATSLKVCFSNPPLTNASTFSAMPVLQAGHTYLLLVCSSLYEVGTGYTMSVAGGTAIFSSPAVSLPHIDSVYPSCNALILPVKLSQPIPCNSFNTNGSEFSISSPYNGSIKSVRGVGCSTGNFTDSLLVDLSIPLTLGTYTLYAKTKGNGSCDNPPLFDSMNFTLPGSPALLDSIVPLGCAPSTLQLVFKQDIDCGSVASDGSDFLLTGTSPGTIVSATPVCINGSSNIIILQLATPLLFAGAYTLALKKGTDGTTLITTCGVSSPEGSSLSFNLPETVSANFTYQLGYGCNTDTLFYNSANSGATNHWNLDTQTSDQQDPVQVVSNALTTLQVTHIVSNGFCSDTSFQDIILSGLNPPLKASFTINSFTCPDSSAIITNNSSGNIVKWNWNFGDGATSDQQSPPPHTYSVLSSSKDFIVTLIIQNALGCADTTQAIIKAISNCSVLVPSAFTPNADGLNDYFGPLNAYNTKNLVFRICNRWGQLVFKTNNWENKWNGTFGENPQPTGIYIWFLSYTDTNTNSNISKKGTVMLIR